MAREVYPDGSTVLEARTEYFKRFHLDDGGYTTRWVTIQAGPLRFAFPNTQDRIRAVRFHDIHHVITGYAADWRGECEIAAFELASGMGDFFTGALLNLSLFPLGLVLCPRRALRAWARGRRSGNLYRRERVWRDEILAERVGDVRTRAGVVDDPALTPADVASYGFALLALAAPLFAVLALAVTLAP